jgi:2-C-methyl-D-erythritol 4-phosphate cytidylyltransferase/2-C-methyl-D-erythritol 2,4-cyclodiphosphate synthase
MPVGIGYDAHRFAPGRRLVLGGVEFEGDGLLGHSDADVATHAIMDALLGAAALGDIGTHFPSSDERYADACSVDLLREVVDLLLRNSWLVGNLDVTIIAERPRVGPRVSEMRDRLSTAASVDPRCVSVKATTNEGMGFIGRGEGIAAIATAEIVRLPEGQTLESPVVARAENR